MGAVEDLGQKLPDGQRIYWVWNVGVGVGGSGGGKEASVLRVVRGIRWGHGEEYWCWRWWVNNDVN